MQIDSSIEYQADSTIDAIFETKRYTTMFL